MSSSFDFTEIDLFTAGAVGEPGSRIFYLQVRSADAVVSFRCEKQQVGALGTYLAEALRDLPTADPDSLPTELDLVAPVIAEWVIGSMGMAYDERADRLVLLAQELVPDSGEPDEGEDPLDDLEDEDVATARFHLTREQGAAFVALAEELLSAGRPPCPICGLPMGPDHNCPRSNGHGRP